ncbi:hypothetical protein RJ641_003535 [Dillenia turbinata]|uniref:Uncharacterized protein n=1 Tax=Dillenia turbinata TaxID=194707 RepID=A0AAN8ZBH8_9MAGN
MENSDKAGGNSGVDENPNGTALGTEASDAGSNPVQTRRTPFTNLSQVDADLALARTLQEQLLFLVTRPMQEHYRMQRA